MKRSQEWDDARAKRFLHPNRRSTGSAHSAVAHKVTADWSLDNDHRYAFLDVGTGPGRLPIEVKTLFPKAKVIGIDPLEYMRNVAQQNAHTAGFPDIEFLPGNAEHIPIDSETIDLAVAQNTFLFWDDAKAGLSEVHRILKPEGKLIILDWNKSYPKWRFYTHNLRLIRQAGWIRAQDVRSSFRFAYPFKTVLQLIIDNNFKPIATEGEKELRFFIKAMKIKAVENTNL